MPGNIDIVVNQVTANTYVGGDATLGNISGNLITGTQPYITSLPGLTTVTTAQDFNVGRDLNIVGNIVVQTGSLTMQDAVLGNIYTNSNIVASEQIYAGANLVAQEYLVGNYGLIHNSLTVGSIATDDYTYANGDPFVAQVSNAAIDSQIANFMPTYGGPILANSLTVTGGMTATTLVTSGTVTAGNLTTPGVVAASGNITTGAYFLGNAAFMTGLPTTGNALSNALVSNYLASGLNTANIITSGNITGNYFLGNVSQATGFPTLDNYGNANVESLLATGITSNIITTGNITGSFFFGNVSTAEGFPTLDNYSNANVQAYLPTYSGDLPSLTGNVTTTANISGAYLLGNGAFITGLPAQYGNANVSTYLASGTDTANIITSGNVNAGNINAGSSSTVVIAPLTGYTAVDGTTNTVTFAAQATAPYAIGSTITVSGAIIAGLNGTWVVTGCTTTSVTWASTYFDTNDWINSGSVSGSVSVQGNISGSYILGNGAFLTGLPAQYGNANVAAYLPTYTGNVSAFNVNAANTVTANLFIGNFLGNITGNLVVPGANTQVLFNRDGNAGASIDLTFNDDTNILTVGGNVTAGYYFGNISQATGFPVLDNYGNANVEAYLPTSPTFTNLSNTVVLNTSDIANNTSNIATLQTQVYGNANVADYLASGTISTNVSTSGNVFAAYYIGDGSQLTNLPVQPDMYGNANVVTLLEDGSLTSNIITTGNTTASNYFTSGILQATGNVRGGNFNTAGQVVADGNITGQYFFGNVSTATGFPTLDNYDNSNVEAFLASGTNISNVITTGNIEGNYILGNAAFLTGLPEIYGDSNVALFLSSGSDTSNIITTGNIYGNFIYGDGSLLANLPVQAGTYGDANVVGLLSDSSLTTPIITYGNVSASYFVGNGALLTGIPVAYGNANVADYLASGAATQPIITTGDVTAGYFFGDGSNLTNLPVQTGTYGDSNVVTLLAGGTMTNDITTSGIVQSASMTSLGTISALTDVNVTGDVNAAGLNTTGDDQLFLAGNAISASSNIVLDPLNDASPLTGKITVLGNLDVTGTITYNDIATATTANLLWIAASDANTAIDATGGGLAVGLPGSEYATFTYDGTANTWNSSVPMVVTGNVTGDYFIGNGSALTGISASTALSLINGTSNVSIPVANGAITFNVGGLNAGYIVGNGTVAFGTLAGQNAQGSNAVAIGYNAGGDGQGAQAVAIGQNAGNASQSTSAIAIGGFSGLTTQGAVAVAVGGASGQTNQGASAVAVGGSAGKTNQGTQAVAVGAVAGETSQGQYAIAIGRAAGQTNQANNTIILNATGVAVNGVAAQTNSFYVAPVRNDTGNVTNAIYYNTSTKEVTYGPVSVSSYGDANVSSYLAGGTNTANIVTTGNVTAGYVKGIGSALTGIVTSLVAGTGVTLSGATGAVTISASGGAAGNSTAIVNGGSLVYIPGPSGNILFNQGATNSGYINNLNSVAFGKHAGEFSSSSGSPIGLRTVSIGNYAGQVGQGNDGIAIGYNSGLTTQGTAAVAIGYQAGQESQGINSVAIGYNAGSTGSVGQGPQSVAIGFQAGSSDQGQYAIAIGPNAGAANQPNNTIILNATSSAVNGVIAQTNSFYVNPVRSDNVNTANVMYYNVSTKEVTYGNAYGNTQVTAYLAGGITGNIVTTGNTRSGNSITTSNIITGGQIQSSAFAGGNISWSVANQTDFQGAIRVNGTGVIKGPGGAASLTLNNNGANTSILGVTSAAISTSTTTGALMVVGGIGVGGNVYSGGNITATGTVTTGNIILNGSDLNSAWTAYTPTWTTTGTNPAIGNGTITGAYKIIGKTCFVRGQITMGSTTTYGTGAWLIGLPSAAILADSIQMAASLLDDGVNWYSAQMNGARAGFTDKSEIQWQNTTATAQGVAATVPMTWGTGDRIIFNGSYQLA